MRTWTEPPAKTDVEAEVRRYFGLLRAGRIPEAEQLVEHPPVRHVLKSLRAASVGAGPDADGAGGGPADGEWEQDLSWLGELELAGFHWGPAGSHFYVEVAHRARTLEVALGFWVKPVDAGWVVGGPSTLW
ncbi:hypothetical protein [Kitasatospora sp. CB02891]|uniref:hypothetical protein n=1 Tax=Kitasatospora sp. CB02891 TaxID=2020329 RepID=UPI000C2811BE|nr:hypothetical protein [Kitasatospora sp. CB02891]PJN28048.1 hypothetical protein CG736_07645 [Kitasatospora sp. CB02891]